jgi:hypothetical protein
VRTRPVFRSIGSAALGALALVHVAWGSGSSWPFADRAALADAVIGRDDVPGPAACLGVASALGLAASLVSHRPRRWVRLHRTAVTGVVTVLAGRGLLGLAGRTDFVSPGSTSRRFRHLDRRCYAPLCLALAAVCAAGARR